MDTIFQELRPEVKATVTLNGIRHSTTTICILKVGRTLSCDRKDQESIQSSTTPVPGYQMGKYKISINITNKSQEVSPYPSVDHKAAINRRESMTNARYK